MNRVAILVFGIIAVTPALPSGQRAAPGGEQRVVWNWGEVLYGRTYRGTLTVDNQCHTEQRVLIVTNGIPDLSIAKVVTLPPNARVGVPYVILPILYRGRLQNESIRGEVIVWHPSDASAACAPVRIVHHVSGRVRTAAFEDAQRDRQALASAAIEVACDVWWLRGAKPTGALSQSVQPVPVRRALDTVDEARCTTAIRHRVTQLRRHLLDEAQSPGADSWRWLPDDAAIARASMADLVALRRRMAGQLRKSR